MLLHGTGGSGLFLLPLLEHLRRVRAIAADRPGQGLSDPIELPRERFRQAALAWICQLFDALDLDSAALLGHSMGGLWSLWYTLARPERVRRLVLLGGTPTLPGTRVPLPFRMMALPGVGALLQRIPSTPKSVTQFARLVGEGDTVIAETLDVLVAAGNDQVAAKNSRGEAARSSHRSRSWRSPCFDRRCVCDPTGCDRSPRRHCWCGETATPSGARTLPS